MFIELWYRWRSGISPDILTKNEPRAIVRTEAFAAIDDGIDLPFVSDRAGLNVPPSQYHFSVDDVLDVLVEASESARNPAEHPILAFLSELHATFKMRVDLYLFLQKAQNGSIHSLREVTGRVGQWLRANPWIRLGPHALNPETPPYKQDLESQKETIQRTYDEIDRLTGPEQYSHWVRLHYFSESYELAPELLARGVQALLTTDKPAASYRLNETDRNTLRQRGSLDVAGIRFIRSHLRVEELAARCADERHLDQQLSEILPAAGCAVVFTHECELRRPEIRQAIRRILSWFDRNRVLAT
jgi:hypothetical protein